MTIIKTNKLEAAYGQLKTAIGLFHHDQDILSVHTLASASYDILMHINRKVGGEPMQIKEETLKRVNPKYKEQVRQLLWNPQNFLKHADKDPDGQIEFDTLLTEIYMFEAATKYHELTKQIRCVSTIYSLWFMVTHPNIMPQTNEFIRNMKKEIESIKEIKDKKSFYEIIGGLLVDRGIK